MIKGLYETHLYVTSLERSVRFYQETLGLQKAGWDEERRVVFFWIGKPKEYMLGIWEKPVEKVRPRHFAFRCDTQFILNESVSYLKERQLRPYNFLKDGTEEPMVFSWMPALSIYFNDPDDHVLEFISVLDGPALPELGILRYADWLRAVGKTEDSQS